MLGDVGKRVSTLVELAEELYEKVTELREQIKSLKGDVEATHNSVEAVERELADHRALLEALAEEQGIDVASVVGQDGDPEHGENGEDDRE